MSIERSFDSIGHFLVLSDGTLDIKANGDALNWGPEPAAMGLTDGVWLIEDGKSRFVVRPRGKPGERDAAPRQHVRRLCSLELSRGGC